MKVGLHPAEKINIKKQAEIGMISRLFFSLYCLSIQIQLLFHQVLGKNVAADAGKNTCHETENKGIRMKAPINSGISRLVELPTWVTTIFVR